MSVYCLTLHVHVQWCVCTGEHPSEVTISGRSSVQILTMKLYFFIIITIILGSVTAKIQHHMIQSNPHPLQSKFPPQSTLPCMMAHSDTSKIIIDRVENVQIKSNNKINSCSSLPENQTKKYFNLIYLEPFTHIWAVEWKPRQTLEAMSVHISSPYLYLISTHREVLQPLLSAVEYSPCSPAERKLFLLVLW